MKSGATLKLLSGPSAGSYKSMLELAPFKAYPFYLSPDVLHGGMYAGFYRYFETGADHAGGQMFLKYEGGGISKYKSWRFVSKELEICPIGTLDQGVSAIAAQTGEMLGTEPHCILGICRRHFDEEEESKRSDHGLCILFLDKIEIAILRQIMAHPSAAAEIPRTAYLPFQMNSIGVGATPAVGFRRGALKSHEGKELWWVKMARENRLQTLDEERIGFIEELKRIYLITPI